MNKNFFIIVNITVNSLLINLIPVQQGQAATLVTNGGFVPTGLTTSAYLGDGSVTVAGWNFGSGGYNFLVPDGTALTTNMAAKGNGPYGALKLFSSGQTVNSPNGSGWFVAADGAFRQGPISQTLTGLTVGAKYSVDFYQALGQQTGFTGSTTGLWAVNLGGTFNGSTSFMGPNTNAFNGGTTLYSNLMSNASQAPVSAWNQQTLTFTAYASSEAINFLAEGTPNGQPPFVLLSGVSAKQVPEPLTVLGTLIGGTSAFRMRKKLKTIVKK